MSINENYYIIIPLALIKLASSSGHNTLLGHHTDRGLMGLGQYNSQGEYCGPHTASSVVLILITLSDISINYFNNLRL